MKQHKNIGDALTYLQVVHRTNGGSIGPYDKLTRVILIN
jgi:hypothetical protein